VAAGFIEAAAVQVLSADREAAARFGDRWAVVPLSVRPAMSPCVGLRATSQLVVPGHTRTFIAGHIRMFTVVPIPIMEPVLWRQVLSPALRLAPQQPPHTTTPLPTALLSNSCGPPYTPDTTTCSDRY
jgi:hypothetical protein